MAQRAKRVYEVDPGPYQDLINDFLASALVDASYGVAVARTAQTIRAKRRTFSERDG